jgi:hypothetical protein
MSKPLLCVLLALAATPALAAGDQPWSEIRVGSVAESRKGEFDLMLIAVNGSRDVPSESIYELAPGLQSLRLASKRRSESGAITALPYTLDMLPCMRYELVADYANPQPNRAWQIAVKAQTPIKSCLKKYGSTLRAPMQVADTP